MEGPLATRNPADPLHQQNLTVPSAYGINLRNYVDDQDRYKKEKSDQHKGGAVAYEPGTSTGSMLWDRTLNELKLEYMDLDEFLSENCVPGKNSVTTLSPATGSMHNPFRQCQQQHPTEVPHHRPPGRGPGTQEETASEMAPANEGACYSMQSLAEHFHGPGDNRGGHPRAHPGHGEAHLNRKPNSPPASVVAIDCCFTKTDLALATIPGQDDFDPSHHPFSEDELKPQPIMKKSRKQFVPNELKDDKYWARRQKNNIAAKRSREVRRVKENQIVLRASYLEKENIALKEEVCKLQQENEMLRERLLKLSSPEATSPSMHDALERSGARTAAADWGSSTTRTRSQSEPLLWQQAAGQGFLPRYHHFENPAESRA